MLKEDCFAYRKTKHKCHALNQLYCELEGKCKFYKTKEQLEEDEEKIKRRKNVL